MRMLFSAVLFIGVLGACTPKESTVRFHVDARTNQGESVSDAVVVIDGQNIGRTANDGSFAGELKLPVGAKKKLEIRKDSDTHYFAPYVQTFDVSSMSPQEVTVAAVLYFVPKPSPVSSKTTADGNSDALPSSQANNNPTVPENNQLDQPGGGNSLESLEVAPKPEERTAADQTADVFRSGVTTSVTTVPLGSQSNPVESESISKSEPKSEPATSVASETKAEPKSEPVESVASEPIPSETASADEVEKDATTGTRTNASSKIFTIHVVAASAPLSGVDITVGEDESSQLKPGCTTNQRGRCVIKFHGRPVKPVTFVASKKGYKTNTIVIPVGNKDKLRIQLEQGRTLDIYAVTESYGHVYGLEEVEVFVRGKKVGATDKFGRYSHVFSGKSDELVTVGLKPDSFIPENFETDFVASEQMTLVKYFAPLEPPAARIAIMPLVASGDIDPSAIQRINTDIAKVADAAARKMFFSSMAFKEISYDFVQKKLKLAGKDFRSLTRHGWRDTDLKAVVDAVVLPSLLMGTKPTLEISVIDNTGRVLAAAKETIPGLDDLNTIDRAISTASQRIDRVFPFEGAVLSREGDKVEINLGRTQGIGLKVGDQLDLYGLQSERSGRSQLHSKIASLTVRSVKDESASCILSGLAPRATVGRGDLVRLRARKLNEIRTAELRVSSSSLRGDQPVPQANIYLDDIWMGATDDNGRIPLPSSGRGQLRIIKLGFNELSQPVDFARQRQIQIALKRQQAFLKVASRPAGGVVKIDGVIVGKTPLAAPIPVRGGFIKLEIDGLTGYKPYSSVLELDQGTLELTGDESIVLEADLRSVAQVLLKAGRALDAVEKLNEIPADHSDYLFARHEAGEIYLNNLDQPAKAAAAFGAVTANEAVKNFNDKRFIASHIDEGIALFATAEKLAVDNPEAARAHYQKALEVLDRVVPFLRFIAANDHDQAVHNVDYHRALCRHRLWMATQDPKLLVETVRGWRNYLEGSARTVPASVDSKSFIGNAEVYLKQASAQLNGARNMLRQ